MEMMVATFEIFLIYRSPKKKTENIDGEKREKENNKTKENQGNG